VKLRTVVFFLALVTSAVSATAQAVKNINVPKGTESRTPQPTPRVIDLKAPDGTVLKATYFAAAKPGPGVLLFHQSNRTRTSWDSVAQKLAAAGINTLTVDSRGHGDSGGKYDNWTAQPGSSGGRSTWIRRSGICCRSPASTATRLA
jgi:predicted acyl esterase